MLEGIAEVDTDELKELGGLEGRLIEEPALEECVKFGGLA